MKVWFITIGEVHGSRVTILVLVLIRGNCIVKSQYQHMAMIIFKCSIACMIMVDKQMIF